MSFINKCILITVFKDWPSVPENSSPSWKQAVCCAEVSAVANESQFTYSQNGKLTFIPASHPRYAPFTRNLRHLTLPYSCKHEGHSEYDFSYYPDIQDFLFNPVKRMLSLSICGRAVPLRSVWPTHCRTARHGAGWQPAAGALSGFTSRHPGHGPAHLEVLGPKTRQGYQGLAISTQLLRQAASSLELPMGLTATRSAPCHRHRLAASPG